MSGERCEPVAILAQFKITLEDLQRMREQAAQLRTMSSINLQIVGQMLDDPCPQTVMMLQGVAKCFMNAQILLNGIDAEIDRMMGAILAAVPPPT